MEGGRQVKLVIAFVLECENTHVGLIIKLAVQVYKQYIEISVTVIFPLLLLIGFNLRIIYAVRYQTLRCLTQGSEYHDNPRWRRCGCSSLS